MRRAALMLCLGCCAASCKSRPTTILLRIEAEVGVPLPDELRLSVLATGGFQLQNHRLPASGRPTLPGDAVLYPREPGLLRLLIRALAGEARVAEGAVAVEARAGEQAVTTLTLRAGALPDRDGDGVPDAIDDCPELPDPEQRSCAADAGAGRELAVGRDLAVDRGRDILPGVPDLPSKLDYVIPVKDGAVIGSPLDLLFVIDNSGTMKEEQQKLVGQFPALIEALRIGGKLPDLRIGVISTDLGAGSNVPSCSASGDGGKLQSKPRSQGCVAPTDPWISHADGKTNVPSGAADPAQRVKDAFACIALLGSSGCGFEQPLEAARRALDPALGVNPGFLRPGALLAIVFLTDEDDCSAKDPALFNPADPSLGPFDSYRCTQHGLQCAESLATPGVKTGCAPGGSHLHAAADYVVFFKALKPTGKVWLAAIAGPPAPVEVALDAKTSKLALKPSCTSAASGDAAPAVRLHAVVGASGGIFDLGIDAKNQPLLVDICSADLSPLMRYLALRLAGAI